MIRRLIAIFRKRRSFPDRDRQAVFERRALRLNNRNPEAAAKMVRKLTILSEGRKAQ